jgi:hypothetical protein
MLPRHQNSLDMNVLASELLFAEPVGESVAGGCPDQPDP